MHIFHNSEASRSKVSSKDFLNVSSYFVFKCTENKINALSIRDYQRGKPIIVIMSLYVDFHKCY